MIRAILVLIVLPLTLITSTMKAYAGEVVISIENNGGDSNNEANVTVEQTSSVQQSNSMEVNNNVNVNADTGNNSASNNSGDTSISTGNINSGVQISNSGNTNSAHQCNGCSANTVNVNITGNGSGSQNSASVDSSTNNRTTQINNARINNFSSLEANTGKNSASNNNGKVQITTGEIYSETKIVNKNINLNSKHLSEGVEVVDVKISENGANSLSKAQIEYVKNVVDEALNTAMIFNSDVQNLNTGRNHANNNNGDVWISTGGIVAIKDIVNENINGNFSKHECQVCKDKPSEEKPPVVTPPPSKLPHHNGADKDNGVGGNGAPGEGEKGNGQDEILPVTGSLLYMWFTLAAVILFLGGWYLRFRSGIAPGMIV